MTSILCFFGIHVWDRYLGYYEERVSLDAVCERCGIPYVEE